MYSLEIARPLQAPGVADDDADLPQAPPVVPGIKLGQALNLLQGFRPGWIPGDAATAPFFAPDTQPLPTFDATLAGPDVATWGFPRVSVHADTNSLLAAVFPYTVRALTGDFTTFSVPPGPLMAGDADRAAVLEKLRDYLGVDLGAGNSYMLVEFARTAGTVCRAYVAGSGGEAADHLKPEALAALGALAGVEIDDAADDTEPEVPLAAGTAGAFIASFQGVGTHYVSQVTAGDRIFQVFAYAADPFAELQAAFQKSAVGSGYVEGVKAMAFRYYTTKASTQTGVALGYVAEAGKLRIASADPAFAASVARGDWNDAVRAAGDSIFEAARMNGKVDLATFKALVPIALELTPIGNLIPVNKSGSGRDDWNRLLKGALLQKYGAQVRVTFPVTGVDWKDVIPNSTGWLTTIATPSVDVYDAHLDVGSIQLTNRAAVKRFSSWSVVLEAGTGTVPVPGAKVSISSYVIDTAGPGTPPTLQLDSEAALNTVSLACGRMEGALAIACAGSAAHKTVVDGIVLETGPVGANGRTGVKVTGDLFGPQNADRLLAQVNNLNFCIVTCQTLLYSRGPTAAAAQELARGCLDWLTEIIPADDDQVSQELAAISLRAGYLGHIARRLDEEGVMVPYLTYQNYADYIKAMVSAASTLNDSVFHYQTQIKIQQAMELTATTAEQINANVKSSGKLLVDYVKAVADNQADVAASYGNIIQTKQRELTSALTSFVTLAQSVTDQKQAVEDAKLEFQQAMVKYETTEIIKAVINISTAFVTVGMSIATPSSTIKALESLGETAQKIQKLVTVLQKIMDLTKTIEGTVKNINAVNQTMSALKTIKLEMPSSMQWSEMGINFDASLATAPSELAGEKAKFSAAFKILVLRAQAMLAAQSKIAQLNAEIALNTAQKKINDDQKARLDKVSSSLNLTDTTKAPDLSEVDLMGLTGVVQSQLNQILASLAQALVIQDSAVQFELLAPPTPIQKFDLESLQIVMVGQHAGIIAAKEAFNPPPFKVNEPIEVTIKGVPISAFTKGNTFEFQIQPSESEFQPYNMVRVQQVVVDIPAIKGSKSGKYRIDLAFEGNPFEDRSPTGDPLTFNTMTRRFGPFAYKAADHSLIFGDQTGSIGDGITRITPFSTWHVRMPSVPDNEELDFGNVAAVDIVLSFRIEALAHPALRGLMRSGAVGAGAMSHLQLKQALLRPAGPMLRGLAATEDAPPAPATLDAMLSQMYKAQGVLKGWDCVLNMLEEPVNRFLAVQYAEKYPSAKPMEVAVGFCQAFPAGPNTMLAYTRFSVKLGPPLLAFQTNNHAFVTVTQQIQSGSIQAGSKLVNQKKAACPVPLDLNDPAIQWDDATPIDVSSKPTVTGSVAIAVVSGKVTPIKPDNTPGDKNDAHTVILDFAKGSFVAQDLNVDTNNAELNLQLQNWFITNPITYDINTVVFNDVTTLKSLQPTAFKLNVLTTNSTKNVLQVFITTTGKQQNNLTINVNEPIPDGYHNSLMINTSIMFNDIFVQSFNKGSSNVQVEAIKPGDDFTAWAAKVSSGTVTGTATFNNTSSSETRIRDGSNDITWGLDGLRFDRTQDEGLALSYDVSKTISFQHRDRSCNQYGCYWSSWNNHSVDVKVKLTGSYPLTVDKDKQEVQIASAPPNVTVTPPDLSPTGPCECNDNDLKIQVGRILQDQVPQKLKDSMGGITFKAVSVFALYNLLFPTKDFIVMQEAYCPADLVVLGTFNKYVT